VLTGEERRRRDRSKAASALQIERSLEERRPLLKQMLRAPKEAR
jgi:hypothetical protein